MAAEQATKHGRKAIFSSGPVCIGCEYESRASSVAFEVPELCNSKKKTTAIWEDITVKVNSCGVARRTADNIGCRSKWKDLKQKVIYGKTAAVKTGGGPPEAQGPYDDHILGIIGVDNANQSGVRGNSFVWLSMSAVLGDEEIHCSKALHVSYLTVMLQVHFIIISLLLLFFLFSTDKLIQPFH